MQVRDKQQHFEMVKVPEAHGNGATFISFWPSLTDIGEVKQVRVWPFDYVQTSAEIFPPLVIPCVEFPLEKK